MPQKACERCIFHVMSYAFLFYSENGKMELFIYFYYKNGAFHRKTRDYFENVKWDENESLGFWDI